MGTAGTINVENDVRRPLETTIRPEMIAVWEKKVKKKMLERWTDWRDFFG